MKELTLIDDVGNHRGAISLEHIARMQDDIRRQLYRLARMGIISRSDAEGSVRVGFDSNFEFTLVGLDLVVQCLEISADRLEEANDLLNASREVSERWRLSLCEVARALDVPQPTTTVDESVRSAAHDLRLALNHTEQRLDDHIPCKACGWSHGRHPSEHEEPPIVRGALDAQADAERALHNLRRRMKGAL